ncbi:ribonuclease P protein component [Bacillus sp. FJAT-27445]|uniref:ribonuclease P protein component n=1 Tax=Bacillus sp. FJAT-27445 TaxID=1679166 RepID=UPI0007439624|nr:ribonuclease P protein component [Bacillus sp. FJAT-27445]
MKKEFRIKKNKEFQEAFKKGRSTANRQFIVYILKKEEQPSFRIGLSVSKKVGNAVVRNRIKRYIRQSIFEMKDGLAEGIDYVIIARKPASEMEFLEVKKSLAHVLKLAKVLKRNFPV